MTRRIEQEIEIDWANWLCDDNHALLLTLKRIDPDDAKTIFAAGCLAGSLRASSAAEAALARINSTLETVGQ